MITRRSPLAEVPPRNLVAIEMEDDDMEPIWMIVPRGTHEVDVVNGLVKPFATCFDATSAAIVCSAVNTWTFN